MTTAELKSQLYKKINVCEDVETLETILLMIENYNYPNNENNLSPEQHEKLEISREQSKNGEFISNEEVDKEVDEWLDK